MLLDMFRKEDIPRFLRLAAEEGWLCEPAEFHFVLDRFPSGCFVVRVGGTAAGFVTSISYGTSGWVGNLLVAPGCRGRGFGRALMVEALGALRVAGVSTVWLTASPEGRPMYERLGFLPIDIIRRWRGFGRGGSTAAFEPVSRDSVVELDASSWGGRRDPLLDFVAAGSETLSCRRGFLVRRNGAGSIQLGPGSSLDPETAKVLLTRVVAAAGSGSDIVLDAPERNGAVSDGLASLGFSVAGSTVLMYRGSAPEYRPEQIIALASMGSMG